MPSASQALVQLLGDAWRLFPANYAEKVSDGAWVRYRWIDFVLSRVHEEIAKGGARIVINAPPRHGKSEALSFWLPAWYLDLYPQNRVILGSYGNRFAAKWGRRVRDHLEQNDNVWTKVKPDKTAANDWATTAGGSMLSVGVDGSVTGEGGDLNIIDDPHKSWREALSPTKRQMTIDWLKGTLYPRLEPGASIVLIQTRWHEGDLTGFLLSQHEEDWIHICLPALAEDNDPLGRAPGEALCPERYDEAALEQIRHNISSHVFAGLYQQRPAPLEGGLVKRDWFQRYTELPDTWDSAAQSWDLTFKAGGTSYVVGQVWLRQGANFFLADQVRERLDFPGTLKAIGRLSERWPNVTEKLIEEAANGHAVISALADKIPGILGRPARGSKEARLAAVSGLIEAGNVWIPEQSARPWADDFLEEVVNFPNGANDDQVDAMTMALSHLNTRSQNFNIAIPEAGTRPSPWRFDG